MTLCTELTAMDKLSKQLSNYLQLMSQSRLLFGEGDKANIDILLTMLGEMDKDIIASSYGILGYERMTLSALADKYHITPTVIQEIIDKDLHKLSITPEWQMLWQQLSPMMKKRLEMGETDYNSLV